MSTLFQVLQHRTQNISCHSRGRGRHLSVISEQPGTGGALCLHNVTPTGHLHYTNSQTLRLNMTCGRVQASRGPGQRVTCHAHNNHVFTNTLPLSLATYRTSGHLSIHFQWPYGEASCDCGFMIHVPPDAPCL